MAYGFSCADGFPFAVHFRFYFILTDAFSIFDVFLDDAVVYGLLFAKLKGQAFLLSCGLC